MNQKEIEILEDQEDLAENPFPEEDYHEHPCWCSPLDECDCRRF